MSGVRCTRCDGTAIDFEGYCWTCEYQNDLAGEAPPDWLVQSEDPFVDFPPLPPERSTRAKIAIVAIPPLLTFFVLALGIGGFYAFKYMYAMMTTPPQAAAGTNFLAGGWLFGL